MMRWLSPVAVVVVLTTPLRAEPDSGRTDGPEGSEYGIGGYPGFAAGGRVYAEVLFGSAIVQSDKPGNPNAKHETDLYGGIGVGYMIEDWVSFQIGFGQIVDQSTSIFAAGLRTYSERYPFNYSVALDAEVFTMEGGEDHFAIAPGAGAELMISDRLRVGLCYQHDFVFADVDSDAKRFLVRLHMRF